MIEGYRRTDPPTVPQLAVPVTVPHESYKRAIASTDPLVKRAGCLMMVAYYFLLRVGEYTKPRLARRDGKMVPATRTKQFTAGNVGFFKEGKILDRASPLDTLLSADLATLKITNQKMGAWAKPSPNTPQENIYAQSKRWRTLCTTYLRTAARRIRSSETHISMMSGFLWKANTW